MNFSLPTPPPLTGPYPRMNAKMVAALFYVEGLLVIFLNFLTLLVFMTNRHLRRRSFYLVMSLTTADLFVGVTAVEYAVFMSFQKDFDYWRLLAEVKLLPICDILMSLSSFSGLVVISVERLYATARPFRHQCMANSAYGMGIAVQWLFMGPLLVTFYLIPLPTHYRYTLGLLLFAGLVVICASYVTIYQKVRQQHLAALSPIQRRERELAKTLLIVTFISLSTWLPLVFQKCFNLRSMDIVVFEIFSRFSSSMVNSIIYVFRMREFKRALYKLLCKCSRDRPNWIYPSL